MIITIAILCSIPFVLYGLFLLWLWVFRHKDTKPLITKDDYDQMNNYEHFT